MRLLLGERPWVVLAEEAADGESYKGFLLYLLAQILRCTSESPRVQMPSKSALEDWTTLADGRITFIPAGRSPNEENRLLKRLQELMASRGAFVVLSGSSHEVEQLEKEIGYELIGASLCYLRLGMSDKESLAKILQSAFGYLPLHLPLEVLLPRDTLDRIAATFEDRFYQMAASFVDRVLPDLRHRSPGGVEGLEHYQTKLYLAWLHRDRASKTEHQLTNGKFADVFVEQENLYYEVETLYGTGDPIAKLNDTRDKYRSLSFREARIVIPNFAALLYLPQLRRFERYLKEEDSRFSLWTLDYSKNEARGEDGLRSLSDVATELRRLAYPLSQITTDP